jgi:hypothetical protein
MKTIILLGLLAMTLASTPVIKEKFCSSHPYRCGEIEDLINILALTKLEVTESPNICGDELCILHHIDYIQPTEITDAIDDEYNHRITGTLDVHFNSTFTLDSDYHIEGPLQFKVFLIYKFLVNYFL